MSQNNKYYYLKLKDDFFSSNEIKVIEGNSEGMIYTNILLKLYLASLNQNFVEGYNTPSGARFESFMATTADNAKMTFKFSGTKLLIASYMCNQGGYADYKIINAKTGEVEKSGGINNVNSSVSSWYENVILTLTGLADTEHILKITTKEDGDGKLFGIGEIWVDE